MHSYNRNRIGWLSLTVAAAMAQLAANVRGAEVEPYEARVIVARAQVRSGPGEKFYPTASLDTGEVVEVYREQSDWLAIRPPQDSFSWVLGRHLKLRDDGLAEINKADIASRIGSHLGDQRNAVQLRLRKGEVVEILGKEEWRGETWYKIAPPAGEFRWIHASQVKRNGVLTVPKEVENIRGDSEHIREDVEQGVVAAVATNESDAAAPPPATPAKMDSNDQTTSSNGAAGDAWRATAAAPRAVAAEAASPLISSTSEPPAAEPTPASAPAAPPSAAPAPSPPAATSSQSAGESDLLARNLTDIELRLARMVAAPPNLWNTERLQRDTEALLADAQSAEDREAAKAMLAKLDQFAAIGRRHQQQARGAVSVGGHAEFVAAQPTMGSNPPPPAEGDSALPPTLSNADASRYDAVGILRPVVSKRPGAPQFALVDERGGVLAFVSPTPDVNLQPYLGHRVGVVGTRGFIPEFQRAHVTAGRVSPLNERRVQ